MKHVYTTDELITLLKLYWAKAEGIEYGTEHEVARCAALKLQYLSAHCLRLERKVRNQRRSLRDNWEIVEQRGNFLGTSTARRTYVNMLRRYRDLISRMHTDIVTPRDGT